MSRIRRAALLVASLAGLTVISILAPSVAPASGASKTRVVVATGSVTCTKVTGSITFTPAVKHVGSRPETEVFTFRASGCTTKNSNVKRVIGGNLKVVFHRPLNSCIDLLSTHLTRSTGTWKPSSIHSTTALFSGYAFVSSKVGNIGFTVPNTGGTAKVTGSFAGKDHGARSFAKVYTNMTSTEFRTGCLSPSGVAKQTIVGGVARFS